jgi:acyl-CoA synthetase (AMP-forming)/AMP-acid ligase II
MQRLSEVEIVDQLPRSTIGKVLKRELRERHLKTSAR